MTPVQRRREIAAIRIAEKKPERKPAKPKNPSSRERMGLLLFGSRRHAE